jgi:dTDP-4-amino-4,6-dideoxygalactose transaminase
MSTVASTTIPFLNLRAQHDPIRAELHAMLDELLNTSAFAGGPLVGKFEDEFAAFCGTKHAVGVGNGTDALWLALLGLGVGPGDEVITVSATFMATAEAISYCGAKPVFIDIDEATYTMHPALIEAAITPRTKAIIPVHLYGQMADMDPIMEIAQRHNLFVVEDACQAHGAEYKGRKAGSIGHAGAFSMYPGKNLGALGEAGAITTNNTGLATRMKTLRDHGQEQKYFHSMIGWNARMDGMQGAALSLKLKNLDKGNAARREHARQYTELFSDSSRITTPTVAAQRTSVYHLYVVRVEERDRVLRELGQRGIGCGIHYPIPVHKQKAYASYAAVSLPVTERYAGEILSLPMYPELTPQQVSEVVRTVKAIVRTANVLTSSAA